jgi:hypothetical protein
MSTHRDAAAATAAATVTEISRTIVAAFETYPELELPRS